MIELGVFSTDLKVAAEWAKIDNVKILDADGWATTEEWERPTTYAEYARRRDESTLEMSVYTPDAARSTSDGTW